jgi:hypothetical protein
MPAAERLLSRALTDDFADVEVSVTPQLHVYEPAVCGHVIEDAWLIGRVDVSLTAESTSGTSGQAPDRAQLIFEAKHGGQLRKLSVRGVPLPQPVAYAAAWSLCDADREAAARIVGTIGISEPPSAHLKALRRWYEETQSGDTENWIAFANDLEWPTVTDWAVEECASAPGEPAARLLAMMTEQ